MEQETLAHRLGTTTHFSPLLMKARRLGLLGPEYLAALAVQRGCRHYWAENMPAIPVVAEVSFSNEELALSLLTIAQSYDPHTIRCGAAMLGTVGNNIQTLARLAALERSERVVGYVAACGKRYEPENPFWNSLLLVLPPPHELKEGVMPHPTRFVAMNGFERRRGKSITYEWQRPQRPAA